MNGYSLSADWFSYMALNSDKVELKHTALYLYIVEMFNKRDWVDVIGLPTDFTMSILNIKSYKTYKSILDDLIAFGFIKLVEKAKNDHTANKIALVKNTKVNTKVSPKYIPKQIESNNQSKSIVCSTYINIETLKPETLKLINDNASLVDLHLKDWIKSELKNSDIDYVRIFESFKRITGKQIRTFGDKEKGQLKQRLKDYSYDDIELAIENCFNDNWHKENGHKDLTLEFILRPDKLSKFLLVKNKSTKTTKTPEQQAKYDAWETL